MAKQPNDYVPDGYEVVYSKFITRSGKKIPPPAGQTVWRFFAKIRKDQPSDQAPVVENIPNAA